MVAQPNGTARHHFCAPNPRTQSWVWALEPASSDDREPLTPFCHQVVELDLQKPVTLARLSSCTFPVRGDLTYRDWLARWEDGEGSW